ncbi:MAG: hypothetical protein ABJX32_04715 [Tateyamaria sp.]|uniref:hypothetical protein n=1 Tax=Tateyamaria sp. TaxID=1929288 RepID=UPI00329FF342
MQDKPISIRLGPRRLEALERYLEANPGETRNGVIAGAVESYLQETGFWEPPHPLARAVDDTEPMATTRPTLSERVRALEEFVASVRDKE